MEQNNELFHMVNTTTDNLKNLLNFLITRIQELETENAELRRSAEPEQYDN
jgi:hypothetical protein